MASKSGPPPQAHALHPSHLDNTTFLHYPSRRSQVMSTKGLAASAQPLASQAGIRILDAGGNAADAAVAMAAALNVTEPCSTGIGGDAFCLYYDAKTKGIRAFNGSGRTPAGMTLEKLREAGIQGPTIPLLSIHAATVPGAPALWVDAVEKLGSGKVDLAQVLAPAIDLAENGYPVHEIVSHAWQRQESQIRDASPSGGDMLLNGKAPLPGQVMTMPHLAQTFRALASKGKDGFYKGRVAEAIVELHKLKGGFMTMEDLADHAERGSEEVDPISYTYRSGTPKESGGVTLHECPPNGQGLTALIALGILDSLQESGTIPPLATMEHNSAEYLHPIIEALRLAFADTMWYVADEQHVHVPVKELLSKEYLDGRAKVFDPKKASDIERGHPTSSSDTVYFSVVDKEGNACSFINSNYAGFGTCAVPKGCGFTLQNRGSGFILSPQHPNSVAPRKRPYHTIIPALTTWAATGDLFLSYGVMGGWNQPQGQIQVLLNILRGLNVQQGVDAPRICIGPGMPDNEPKLKKAGHSGREDGSGKGEKTTVSLEEGIDAGVVETLRGMGHDVELVTGWGRGLFGRGQVIQRLYPEKEGERHAWTAGSDLRADGAAVPQV